MVKILHTSDWHLGKKIFGVSLLEEQEYVLQQMKDCIREEKIQLLIIAGDIFDRTIPPIEALEVFEEFLWEIRKISQLYTIIIPGNHDSGERLSFLNSFLEQSNIYISNQVENSNQPISLEIGGQQLNIYLFPYAEEAHYRKLCKNVFGTGEGLGDWVEHIGQSLKEEDLNIAVAHTFLQGAMESDSERSLEIGGEYAISANQFQDFDYVALGHLHKAQKVGKEWIRYSGALYKYSFSEAMYSKYFTVLELEKNREYTIKNKTYSLGRDLKIIKGNFQDILEKARQNPNETDFIKIILIDDRPILDPMPRLKPFYPNLLLIEREYLYFGSESPSFKHIEKKTKSTEELLSNFYEDVYEKPLLQDEIQFIQEWMGEKRGQNED